MMIAFRILAASIAAVFLSMALVVPTHDADTRRGTAGCVAVALFFALLALIPG